LEEQALDLKNEEKSSFLFSLMIDGGNSGKEENLAKIIVLPLMSSFLFLFT
jgi:hypothetical protein